MATWDGTSVYYSLAVMGQWYNVNDSSTAVISSCRMPGRREMVWEKIEYKSQRLSKMKSKAGIIRLCVNARLLQSCLTLCDSMDCSLPGSSVHGILQARILEWITSNDLDYNSQSSGKIAHKYINNNRCMTCMHLRELLYGKRTAKFMLSCSW